MNIKKAIMLISLICSCANGIAVAEDAPVLKAGHPSLKEWILPPVPTPKDNALNAARVDLGRDLFFDPHLSGEGNMSCATCHNPALGWSDGLPTAKGVKSTVLGRASPTIIDSAFDTILMWDGRKKDLEDQATGPLEAELEMHVDTVQLVKWLNSVAGYRKLFEAAYPGEGVNTVTLAKAIAAFERTIVMNDSPFDKWLAGDAKALTPQQVRGFGIFLDAKKGNCAACHSAPNFTDNGFHNLGLASWGNPKPDVGRYAQKPVAKLKGAFKTPQLRGITLTAPYFHDGSAKTLEDVVNHYVGGGVDKSNLDPNIHPLALTEPEKQDLLAFLNALTGTTPAITIPVLPQ
jgi:cytochrome c peroxidase